MQTKYRVHIENLAIPNFSELMIRVKKTEVSVNDIQDKENP